MSNGHSLSTPAEKHLIEFSPPSTPYQHSVCLLITLALLTAGTGLVYATGGTSYAFPYVMLVPVLFAAACYHLWGGVIAAGAAGLLIGPLMPLDIQQDVAQSSANWLLRLGFYVALGGFAGVLFGCLANAARQREGAMRITTCGLPNQAALLADLDRSLSTARDRNKKVAVVLIQITDLTEILSGVGAGTEDVLLSAIAHNIRRDINHHQIYHLGAAELVVLLEYDLEPELQAIVEKISAVGEESVVIHNVPVRAQLVAGISRSHCSDDPRELIRQVRMAAFEACEQQQPYCHYATEFERDTAETMRLVGQIRRALAAGEFELFFQPKIRLADNRVDGCEALLRWRDRKGNIIAPGLFMPKVERTTLIAPVTRFVALEACKHLVRLPIAPISINFTVGNLFDVNLLEWLIQLVEDERIAPHSLEIEITEGAIIKNHEAARKAIGKLKDAGVCVLLDDFGTGYSSFEHLRHLPISGLKIDRAFVKDLECDVRAKKLMACIINVAHALGLTVTAEGVETFAQAELLRELGCDLAQGFFFARPMPGRSYQSWLQKYEETADLRRPNNINDVNQY